MSLALSVDRYDYVEGSYAFWAEHHQGQFSDGYARLSRLSQWFTPGPLWKGWESLSEEAQDVYRAWCRREGVACVPDLVQSAITEHYDDEDPCVEYFISRYGDEEKDETALVNYDRSDFVNIDMPYTADLLRFYNNNEDSILYWADQACDAYGCNSRLQLVEGGTVETPDDFATALVNAAMTYLGRELLTCVLPDR